MPPSNPCPRRGRAPLALAVCLAIGVRVQAQDNILIVVADDLGVDQLAAYGLGHGTPDTPNIDVLAAGGLLFRNAYANPTCSPSRASLQTGRHAFRTGVGDGVDPDTRAMQLWETTIPEMLDAGNAGYAHAAFGKWHLGNVGVGGKLAPNLAGWGHYAGVLGNLGPDPDRYFTYKKVTDGVTQVTSNYLTTEEVDDAIAWIGAQNGPWLCYLAFHAPHQPFHAPPDPLHTVHLAGVPPPDVEPRPYYRAMVQALDTELGRLLASLGPELQDTWVFFLGDNGTPVSATVAPFDPFHAKGTVYEGGVHVPMIVHKPGTIVPGSESDALVGIVDLFATVADIAGVSPTPEVPVGPWPFALTTAPPFGVPSSIPATLPPPLDSVSLMPYLIDPATPSLRSTVLGERFEGDGSVTHYRTIRDARYKYLVHHPSQRASTIELYDLDTDPLEVNDLLLSPLSPGAAIAFAELESALDALLSSTP